MRRLRRQFPIPRQMVLLVRVLPTRDRRLNRLLNHMQILVNSSPVIVMRWFQRFARFIRLALGRFYSGKRRVIGSFGPATLIHPNEYRTVTLLAPHNHPATAVTMDDHAPLSKVNRMQFGSLLASILRGGVGRAGQVANNKCAILIFLHTRNTTGIPAQI
jgi:hypothetical protein